MRSEERFHLIDAAGNSLEKRYKSIANQLKQCFQLFPKIDPADLDETVERVVQTVAAREAKQGPASNLKPYVFRAFKNAVADLLRTSRYRARLQELPLTDEERREIHTFAYEGNPAQIEMRVAARQALNRLDVRKKEIVLAWLTGYSAEEIAAQFGVSLSNVYTTLSRARQELRQILTEGPTNPAHHNDLNDGKK